MAPAEAKKKIIKKAGKLAKPMAQLECIPSEDQLKTLDGDSLKLIESWGTNLDKKSEKWVFDLFHDNMYDIFILVETNNGQPVGYCHYRFVLDHDIPVLYCYELQVSESFQQKGIGSLLMNILESIAKKAGMSKVLATVFAFNAKSLGFFHKNGYIDDETCPKEEQGFDYLILSKNIQ